MRLGKLDEGQQVAVLGGERRTRRCVGFDDGEAIRREWCETFLDVGRLRRRRSGHEGRRRMAHREETERREEVH